MSRRHSGRRFFRRSAAEPPRSVLFLCYALDQGGAQRQLLNLARGLQAAGWEVMIAVLYGGGALDEVAVSQGIPLAYLNRRGRWDIARPIWRTLQLARRRRAQFLHGYLDTGNILASIVGALLPRCRVVWGIRASNMDLTRYETFRQTTFKVMRLLVHSADAMIVNSYAGRDYHAAQGFPLDRMALVPNGIDTDAFQPDESGGIRLRQEWDVAPDKVLIGMVARIDPMKDHETFLRAAAVILRQRDDVRFVCVGAGDEEATRVLRAEAHRLRLDAALVWAGSRNDMAAIYSAFDIVCLSSRWGEGFPNVVAEAMACAVPVVVTNVGDSAAVVGPLGEVVEPGSGERLAEGVMRMIDRVSREPALGTHCRRRAVQEFSLSRLVESTEQVLHATLAGRRTGLFGLGSGTHGADVASTK